MRTSHLLYFSKSKLFCDELKLIFRPRRTRKIYDAEKQLPNSKIIKFTKIESAEFQQFSTCENEFYQNLTPLALKPGVLIMQIIILFFQEKMVVNIFGLADRNRQTI